MKLHSLNSLRKRILKLLNPLFKPEDLVNVSISGLRRIHITVVSETFNDLDWEQRDELVWPKLEQHLSDDELNRIGMCVLLDPQEGALLIPDLAGTQNEIAHAS